MTALSLILMLIWIAEILGLIVPIQRIKKDVIAYFSARIRIGPNSSNLFWWLGILSGDHLKSASDLGIPLVAVGLLYRNGYFYQKINGKGVQETEYKTIDLDTLPITKVKGEDGEDLIIYLKFPKKGFYLKVWQIIVGRVTLYLLDSDIDENIEEYRSITTTLYGGNQETRIQQEWYLEWLVLAFLRASN